MSHPRFSRMQAKHRFEQSPTEIEQTETSEKQKGRLDEEPPLLPNRKGLS